MFTVIEMYNTHLNGQFSNAIDCLRGTSTSSQSCDPFSVYK